MRVKQGAIRIAPKNESERTAQEVWPTKRFRVNNLDNTDVQRVVTELSSLNFLRKNVYFS